MTKTKLIIAASIIAIGFTACESKETKRVEVLTTYVDSVDALAPVYTTENWTAIDNGYQARLTEAEAEYATLDADAKAKADATKAKYEALKAKYEAKLREAEAAAQTAANATVNTGYKKVIRDRLFGEGKIGDDMQFGFVTADNILSVYQNFVDVVAENRKAYTVEDWDEIKVLYEALDSRKNALEKDIKTSDNLKIAGLKVKMATIATTHKPAAKVKEAVEAKQ